MTWNTPKLFHPHTQNKKQKKIPSPFFFSLHARSQSADWFTTKIIIFYCPSFFWGIERRHFLLSSEKITRRKKKKEFWMEMRKDKRNSRGKIKMYSDKRKWAGRMRVEWRKWEHKEEEKKLINWFELTWASERVYVLHTLYGGSSSRSSRSNRSFLFYYVAGVGRERATWLVAIRKVQ